MPIDMRLTRLFSAALLFALPATLPGQEYVAFNAIFNNFAAGPTPSQVSVTKSISGTFNSVLLTLTGSVDNGASISPNGPGGFYVRAVGHLNGLQTLLGSFGTGDCADTEPLTPTTCTFGPDGGATFGFAETELDAVTLYIDLLRSGEGGVTNLQASATLTNTTVPEPSTYVLMAAGLVGIAGVRRRRAREHRS